VVRGKTREHGAVTEKVMVITTSNTTDREEKRREEVFSVTEVMRALVAGDVSYIETTVTQLRDQPQTAWAALFYSCAPRFDYWLRHMPRL
jgi:hypothetical protein